MKKMVVEVCKHILSKRTFFLSVIFRYKIPILGKKINLNLEDYSDGCSVAKL